MANMSKVRRYFKLRDTARHLTDKIDYVAFGCPLPRGFPGELVAVRNYSATFQSRQGEILMFPGKARAKGVSTAASTTGAVSGPDLLRRQVQRFVRAFGLLADDRTPCGAPLSPRAAHALMIVLERERVADPPRQNDLAAALGIDKSNITRLVQRLSNEGRIRQLPVEDDGRARILRLTQKGRRLAETIERTSRARFEALLANIPADSHELVLSALALLNEASETSSPEALPPPEERTTTP